MNDKTKEVACPTCGAIREEPCIRGRIGSPVWCQGVVLPEGHDSRRSANKHLEFPGGELGRYRAEEYFGDGE